MELDNGMTRFIAGDEDDLFINRTPIGQCDTGLLKRAQQNLDSYFSFIGLMERYDESVLLLAHILGWKNAFYLRRNTIRENNNPVLSQDIIEEIKAKNILDILLYDYAKKRFENDLAAAGVDQQSLDRFRKMNALYSGLLLPPYEIYDSLKALVQGQWGRPR